uniref:coiled-coil domain-containing protein 14 n=1 Tax=Jaculus jaculus TaxID=51337 RepID=UPI001E1B3B3F|nr:coiled-coil domain-containing protein 14 [Jaculus jaculus]
MVRSGSRPGQVLSSGRQPGSAKLTNGKKGINLRKTARINAESGYPIHSDSESQSETAHGLDGCASLLRDILRNEDSGSEIPFSENRYKSRPLAGKNCGSKKKGHEKHIAPSIVRKEILSSNKKQIPNEASSGSERDTADLAQNCSLQDYRLYSPMIYQALCEHVQTQMSLMNNLPAKNDPHGVPAVPCHSMPGSESQATSCPGHGSCTSGPIHATQPQSCSPVVCCEVQTNGDNQLGSQGQTTSANYPSAPRNAFSIHPGVPCSSPHTGRAAIPTWQQLSLANWILPQQRVPKEADLLKCLQTHMSLLQSHGKEIFPDSQTHQRPTQSHPAFLATNEEKCAKEQIGEATNEGKYSNIHVQDAKIAKDVQKAKNVNYAADKVRTVKYLLGELKALVTEQEDSETQRLVTELESCISGLLEVNGHTNIQVEIALAMQPLRNENAHLRRQLRIMNQHLREQEETRKAPGNLELFSLKLLNLILQNQLEESLKSQGLLHNKNEELLKVIEDQRSENKKLTGIFKDKDQALLENKQQFDIEMTRMKIELEEALANMKNAQLKLETTEKENQILGITLRQRDAEVSRLRELTRTLQNSMAKLLSDLSMDTVRCKPGNSLTKSLLNIYDKQLQQDPNPLHTSIMSYLSKLETDHQFTHSELLSTIKHENAMEPNRPYENIQPAQVPPSGDTKVIDEVAAPGILSTRLEQASDSECETMTLIEDEYNLDNTIYIPFARSTSEKHPSLSKRSSPQPKVSAATSQLVDNSALISQRENKQSGPVVCSLQNKAEDVPQNPPRTPDREDIQLLRKIKEALSKIPAAATQDPEKETTDPSPSPCHVTGVQGKGNVVSDGSFLNSDFMSDWSISSLSTFTSHDEQDFRNGLAALDANIARLQKSLNTGLLEK